MPITLADFAAADTDYIVNMNNNNDLIEGAIASLEAAVSASSGEASLLLNDEWDRDGIVGITSFRLDLDAYAGGASIDVGRRPAPNVGLGELDLSIGWGTYGGNKARVAVTGDTTVSAAAIIAGLPKTIYMCLQSGGTIAFEETLGIGDRLYLYSMTWDGIDLSEFKRLAPYLPAYTTFQEVAAKAKYHLISDEETSWLDDTDSLTSFFSMGDDPSNGIDVTGEEEIIGFMVAAVNESDDGFSAYGTDNDLVLRVHDDDGYDWTADITIDCSALPQKVFAAVDTGSVGDRRFNTTSKRLFLQKQSIGTEVVSARSFTWAVITRPLHGGLPKNNTYVTQI